MTIEYSGNDLSDSRDMNGHLVQRRPMGLSAMIIVSISFFGWLGIALIAKLILP